MSSAGFTRREMLHLAGKTGVGAAAFAAAYSGANLLDPRSVQAGTLGPGLSDPALQPKFTEVVPNALDPGFIYRPKNGKIKVELALAKGKQLHDKREATKKREQEDEARAAMSPRRY